MYKGALGIHKIKLMVKSGPGLGDGRGVGQHADAARHFGEVTARDNGGRLVVDANLEAGGAPVHKLDGALGLDLGDGSVDVLGDNVTAIEHAAGHVLAMAGIALHHLVGWFKAGVGDLGYSELLVIGLLGRDDWSIDGQGEVDPGVGHQVGLELREIHVESAIKAEGGSDGGHNLANEPVQVCVGWSVDVQVAAANVIDGLIVNHEGTIGVLQSGVSGQDRVVRLNNSSGDLGSRVDREFQLGLLSIVNRESFHEERSEARASSPTKRVENEEPLETGTLISQLTNSVQHEIHYLLANGVMSPGIVVGGIFLASDQLFRVEQLTVGTSANFIHDSWFQVYKDRPWNMLSSPRLREEGVKRVIPRSDGLV